MLQPNPLGPVAEHLLNAAVLTTNLLENNTVLKTSFITISNETNYFYKENN